MMTTLVFTVNFKDVSEDASEVPRRFFHPLRTTSLSSPHLFFLISFLMSEAVR